MKSKEIYSNDVRKPAGHYCHAHEVDLVEKTYYISGQLPITTDGQALSNASFEQQVQQVFDNFDAILAACECGRQNLVQVRIYITDMEHWPLFDKLYSQWIGSHKPARCVVPVPTLHHGCKLEMEAVAAR
ncbi:MAG: RidA family protein [Deferribacteraceae bacterium]|jgi:reactive intermediate/imine deaminase|nr:RidA family protein [Deferribacteraceae bacterium]